MAREKQERLRPVSLVYAENCRGTVPFFKAAFESGF
jgi:hypothetical protein